MNDLFEWAKTLDERLKAFSRLKMVCPRCQSEQLQVVSRIEPVLKCRCRKCQFKFEWDSKI